MSFVFPPAPVQTGSGTITIHFLQFFYVVYCTGEGKKKRKGAVVLLASGQGGNRHNAYLTGVSESPLLINDMQIDIFRGPNGTEPEAISLAGMATKKSGNTQLPETKDLYGKRVGMKKGIVAAKPIPATLNSRVVVAGGEFTEKDPYRGANAKKAKFDFSLGAKVVKTRGVSDQITFESKLEKDFEYWLVWSKGTSIVDARALGRNANIFGVANLDGEHQALGKGRYSLPSYRDLHAAVLDVEDYGHMEGEYDGDADDQPVLPPLGQAETRGVGPQAFKVGAPPIGGFDGSAEPVCGGEHGEPDPPEDPPDPPNP